MPQKRIDGRVERGNQTRRLVLQRTTAIASMEGLEALSLGRLATELKLSKSGIFALFGSKEELQLATVRAAAKIYADHVVLPALASPIGLHRVKALCEGWIDYSHRRVFPGGCFFQKAIMEFCSRPGQIQNSLSVANSAWRKFVHETVSDAQRIGEIRPEEDTEQLAFELTALLESANSTAVLINSDRPYGHARRAIEARLRAAAAPAGDYCGPQPAGVAADGRASACPADLR